MKLTIKNLSKTYQNGVQALKGIDLEIASGMFGLLGPNGAGKSTLMRTIATLQEPDTGTIMLDGLNVLTQKRDVRSVLGYLPQEFGVYPKVTAESLLNHLAILKGIGIKSERRALISALLHKTNLYEVRKKNLSGYSGGMKQRFGIAQALLSNPKLIIVDEPTAGLDPAERNRFHNLLAELADNTIVILSTHIVEDIKELCTNMAIINQGRVLLTSNPREALTAMDGMVWEKQIDKSELITYKKSFPIISEKMYGGKPIVRAISDKPLAPVFQQVKADLEDVYFASIRSYPQTITPALQ